MYETNYDKLQPYFRQENLQLHYIDTDGIILSMRTENFIEDLKILEDMFDFSNLDENHEIFSNKNKKYMANLKLKPLKMSGLTNLFVWEVKRMLLNVVMRVKIK